MESKNDKQITAVKEKLSFSKKLKRYLFVGTRQDIEDSFVEDILFPAIKDFVIDAFSNAVGVAMFGRDERGWRRGIHRRSGSSRRSREFDRSPTEYATENKRARETGRTRTAGRYIFENITFYDEFDKDGHKIRDAIDVAYDVRDALYSIMDKNEPHRVTVYEFYDECELTGDWADQEWGWRSFGKEIEIRFVRDGVQLVLDEPEYLGRR